MSETVDSKKETPPHKNAKGGKCDCKIGIDHNTKVPPHKDHEGRNCSGPIVFDAKNLFHGKRFCSWCHREESYSPVEITVIFRKDVTETAAVGFIMDLKLKGQASTIVADKARGIVTKKDIVAVTVSAGLAGGSIEEWIVELEKRSDVVWAAVRSMVVSFPNYQALAEQPKSAKAGRKGGEENFPDEFSGV